MDEKAKNIYKNLERQIDKIAKHNRQGSFKTKERYHQANKQFCKHVAEKFSTQKFSNISNKHVESYIGEMKSKGLAPSTIKTNVAAVRFYHDKCSYARNQLAEKFDIDKRQFGGVDRTWSDKEVNGMVNYAKELGQERVADVMTLARHSGLRIHEAMRIDKAMAEKAVRTEVLTVKGKGGKIRDIPLNRESKEVLQRASENANRGDKLFLREHEKTHLAIKQVQNWIGRHRDKFEVPGREAPATFHGLRHTFAQERYKECTTKGLNDYRARVEVSKELGHERDDVTRIYLND